LEQIKRKTAGRISFQEMRVLKIIIAKEKSKKKSYPPCQHCCQHCGKMGHPPFKYWKRPDVKCSKCNKLGHEVVICKEKFQYAQVANQEEEED